MFDLSTSNELQQQLPTLPFMVMEQSLRNDIDDLVKSQWPKAKLAIVCDRNTYEALGERVYKALKRFEPSLILLSDPVEVDDAALAQIEKESSACDALIAVGSGTINDLCKYSAAKHDKPYIVLPTAASMNGYVSANASITLEGHKTTLPARMPQAVFCDLSVITAAPSRLAKSGLGDSVARSTAQVDWLLSHLLLGTTYREQPFSLLTTREPQLFDQAKGIAYSDPATIRLLMEILLLSGFGMTLSGGSYPASQAEHMVAHAFNMGRSHHSRHVNPMMLAPILHGEEIAVTTLTIAAKQERLLQSTVRYDMQPFHAQQIQALYGEVTAESAQQAFAQKYTRMQELARGGEIISNWPSIAERLASVMLPAAKIRAVLEAAQCPTTIEALQWDAKEYDEALQSARFLRDRFTCLDLRN
ncbi:MAG: iron-containing alcohol dehydrogenase [Rickettsiales bacterium]|nr:iron-containing alcohol dehydrogenase [Rickettsiales bacterium]